MEAEREHRPVAFLIRDPASVQQIPLDGLRAYRLFQSCEIR